MKAVAAIPFLFFLPAAAQAEGICPRIPLPTTSDILLDIEKVRSEKAVARFELAEAMTDDLLRVRRARAVDRLDDRVIDELIALLNDDDDSVRANAAAGIGFFGTRARRAAPALERALERIWKESTESGLVFQSGVTSASAIAPALKRIRGIPDSETFDDAPKECPEP